MGRQLGGAGNRGLHVLRGGVDVAVQAELQVMLVWPWLLEDEVIESMPGMVENCVLQRRRDGEPWFRDRRPAGWRSPEWWENPRWAVR